MAGSCDAHPATWTPEKAAYSDPFLPPFPGDPDSRTQEEASCHINNSLLVAALAPVLKICLLGTWATGSRVSTSPQK
jgi:hypothetical protein